MAETRTHMETIYGKSHKYDVVKRSLGNIWGTVKFDLIIDGKKVRDFDSLKDAVAAAQERASKE